MIQVRKTDNFAKWIDKLDDIRARARILARYDVAEHLRNPEDMAAYLEACIEEAQGDASFIAKALGDIARAKGMAQVARDAGLSRESLYKALSGERSPSFDTILKVIGALGLRIHLEAVDAPDIPSVREAPVVEA